MHKDVIEYYSFVQHIVWQTKKRRRTTIRTSLVGRSVIKDLVFVLTIIVSVDFCLAGNFFFQMTINLL